MVVFNKQSPGIASGFMYKYIYRNFNRIDPDQYYLFLQSAKLQIFFRANITVRDMHYYRAELCGHRTMYARIHTREQDG